MFKIFYYYCDGIVLVSKDIPNLVDAKIIAKDMYARFSGLVDWEIYQNDKLVLTRHDTLCI